MKPAQISPLQLALIWEVYAAIGLTPMRAVALLRQQEVRVTPLTALREIRQARRRNTLRLVRFY